MFGGGGENVTLRLHMGLGYANMQTILTCE